MIAARELHGRSPPPDGWKRARRVHRAQMAGRRCGLVLATCVCCATAGCAPAIRWRLDTFESVHAEARAANKLTFVYFRDWSMVECTDFEENVLSQPAAVEATRDMVCVPLNFTWDRPLAEEWGLRQCPAIAIVDPQRRVLAGGAGKITLGLLLEWIHRAKTEFALSTQPTPKP